MPQFEVGQNVIHPTHGAGEVIGIEQMDLLEEFNRYYVIAFDAKRLTLRIPVRKVDELKIRRVMSQEKLSQVLTTLCSMPQKLPSHFKARRREVEELIQSGYPNKIAQAVRELTWREQNDRLNKIDMKLLSQGREMLIREIALVTGNDQTKARERLERALAQAMATKAQQQPVEVVTA